MAGWAATITFKLKRICFNLSLEKWKKKKKTPLLDIELFQAMLKKLQNLQHTQSQAAKTLLMVVWMSSSLPEDLVGECAMMRDGEKIVLSSMSYYAKVMEV